MKFKIEEKIHELTEGYLMVLIKYSVVFFLAWMIGILIVFTYPCFAWSGDKYPPALEFINDYNIITWILVAIGFYFYTVYLIKKSRNGLLIEIEFLENKTEMQIINTFSGKVKLESIPSSDLKIILEEKPSKLYGNLRTFHFYSNNTLITSLNLDLTAWKNHSSITNLTVKLNSLVQE